MRESFSFRCGDPDALVTYLYDECDRDERAVIEAHLAACFSCSEEVATLRGTRAQLASWTPPAAKLGFVITAADAPPTGQVLTPARPFGAPQGTSTGAEPRWWSKPLPAWAQIAAAGVIFTTGLGIGSAWRVSAVTPVARSASTTAASASSRSGTPSAVVAPASSVPAPVPSAVAVAQTVSAQDLDRVEQRLRHEIAQLRAASPAARASNDDVLKQVQALIAESEQRQQRALIVRTGQLEEQRRVDLTQMQHTVGEIQNLTNVTMRNQDQYFRYLVNVSQRR